MSALVQPTSNQTAGVPDPWITGAEMLVEALRSEGVEVIFGYPGGAVLPLYDALYECGIPHVLTRHEQGAIHAAEGYARVSGKTGVVIATSGPGATNLVTGLADAMLDSLPIVAITGQVPTSVIGSDAFQETSIISISTPITKHNYQVRTAQELPGILKEAFHIASTGRPGPVLIDIPKDVANASGIFDYQEPVQVPGYQPTIKPNQMQLRKVVSAIRAAKKPVILAGAGVLHAKAHESLRQFAEQTQIPVVHTLLGLGGFPADHSLYLGMGGMHGSLVANMALYETDLLINIGARFDDRLTGNLQYFAKNAVVVHIDIDPAEIGKNVRTHIPVVGDAGESLKSMLDMELTPVQADEWMAYLLQLRDEYPFWYQQDGTLKPQRVMEIVHQQTQGEAVVVTDVGQHQMWAAQFYPFNGPHRWVTSGGLGTMGFGLPAAIGAQLGAPDRTVVAIVGDAGFQMTLQELSVLAESQLPVKVIIFNNHSLGMVRQWQELFYEGRYSETLLSNQPDFVKLADAYHIPGFRVEGEEDFARALQAGLATDGPVLIECRINPEENVFPMVAPGKGIHEMVGVKP
ncbi:acetolactate synthase large subunit [Alicyclobacillaceae bacterium I2511]|nr:acetolactate synthase large subunit [Alicyclobacillaceae bacterium I2511]